MGVRSCVSDFVGTWVTWSYSKLWSALPRRHASSPGSSAAPNHDVLAARCRWAPHVIRDSHTRSFLETAVSELQAFLCHCRDPDRCGPDVQPGLARADTSMANYRFCLGLQPGLDDSPGRGETRALWNSRSRPLVEEISLPAAPSSHGRPARGAAVN